MPVSHNAILRYQALDACFSDFNKYYFVEDLVAAVNRLLENNGQPTVSKRTVQYDIQKMESNHDWNVLFEEPALKNGRRYYRYQDSTYSIFKRDLSSEQLSELKSTLLLLNQFKGLPQFEKMEALIRDLEKQYDFALPDSLPMIEFDNNEYLEGLKYLVPLLSHIMNHQPLDIKYHPFGREPFIATCHPYFLKQYNKRWFLFALDHKNRYISNYPIDRIEKVTKAKQKFIPSEYDFTEYFDDLIGVTKSQLSIEKVVLRFTEDRLPYVLSKPLHHSQKFHKDSKTVSIKVIVNRELIQLLLSFGADVEVIEPAHLRQDIENLLVNALNNYHEK